VIPPDELGPGGAACGFVEVLYDESFYAIFLGFDVPVAPAVRVVVAELDRRSRKAAGAPFVEASVEAREALLDAGLAGRFRLVFEALIALCKVTVFGGQGNQLGWEILGYPGPADAYPDAAPPGPAPTHGMTDDGNPP